MGDLFGGGGDAAEASKDAAQIQSDYQREALEYLKEREALPQEYREQAITRLGGRAGLGSDPMAQEKAIASAKQSPLYAALLKQGEEAALRTGSATGGLRSGNTYARVGDAAQNALLSAYNQQGNELSALAGLPSLAPAIAQSTSGIGQTLAQGEVGAAQSAQAGNQQGIGNLFGLANLGMSAYQTFSDIRLKSNIKKIGIKNGFNWYRWDWNEKASMLGLTGSDEGVMAHEIMKIAPDAIGQRDGYVTVDMRITEAA